MTSLCLDNIKLYCHVKEIRSYGRTKAMFL